MATFTYEWRLSVRADERLKPLQKLILYALATYMNKDGYCYPGIEALATATGLHRRTIERNLSDLSAWVTVGRRDGPRATNTYWATLPDEPDEPF